MSDPALWRALGNLADTWRQSPAHESFARELPENAPQRSDGLSRLLQWVHATASGVISNPLLLASLLPMAASVIPGVDERQLRAKYHDWFDAASRVEKAYRQMFAWLRGRMPGYPNLPAIQLAPGAPLTTLEFTHRLIWTPGERAQQLHLRDVPPEITNALLADAPNSRSLAQEIRNLGTAVADSPEWAALATAAAELDNTARDNLRAARSRARERLATDAVNAYETNLALPRAAYREHVVREEIDSLSGAARVYSDAFDAVDGLLEMIGSVFGQIVCYTVPRMIASDLEIVPRNSTVVRFTTTDTMPDLPKPGALAWLDDPLVPDAIRITEMAVNIDEADDATVDLTADVLNGTAVAWRDQAPR